MKITLVVQRDPDSGGAVWVTAAADEYTWDSWDGEPDFISEALAVDPANTRLLDIRVPDDAMESAFSVPEVEGEVLL